MDKPKVTPKDFFLWAGAMLSLYVSVFSFLGLMFEYINYAYPDPLEYFPADPYTGGISYQMASLIVLVPLFLVLMYFIHRDIKRDASRREVWVRRWALVLTIFVAAATVAIDLIILLMNFFNGGLDTPFVLKILSGVFGRGSRVDAFSCRPARLLANKSGTAPSCGLGSRCFDIAHHFFGFPLSSARRGRPAAVPI